MKHELLDKIIAYNFFALKSGDDTRLKYSETSRPLQCMMKNSTCYKQTCKMQVKGVLWHSTGANNPYIKRYVQPYETDANYADLIRVIGENKNRNDWNHVPVQAGLNCWIGKLADGTVSTVQTMPWDYRPWGCGSGKNGSCNSGWIQFEICEDGLDDEEYFSAVYREACEITAYLCKMFGIDPHGTAKCGSIDVPTILCHRDSYDFGLGSGHADIRHWFPKFGKSMDTVRDDVAALIASAEEDDNMDKETFKALWMEMRKDLQDNDSSAYSQEARDWAVNTGLIQGGNSGEFNGMWEDIMTREQLVTVLYRFAKLVGMA